MNGSATIANQTAFTAGFALGSPMNSPFTTLASALYQQNINYRFENFLNEVRPSYGLNGGLSLGMSSGVIGQSDYENGYGWVYCDLSRKISPASDDIARSIQVIGTNNSSVQIDYYCIVFYEREITLSTSTGSLVI